MVSSLKLLLLGSPYIERDGQAIELTSRKEMALLAYLATTSPSPSHSRDALSTLLWPDYDQQRARTYLRQTLWLLNKVLGEAWLEISREYIGLNPAADIWLDLAEFQRRLTATNHGHPANEVCTDCLASLTGAVELYRGDFLAGFTLSDAPHFDEWQFFQAESLRQALASALDRLVQGHSAQRDAGREAAIPYARRRLALDPLHEPTQRQLMQLYARTGQQAAALRQYQECIRLLEAELGTPPEQETTQLYEAIKAKRIPLPQESKGETFLSAPQLHGSPVPPLFLSSVSQPSSPPAPFVARERELTALSAALESARVGRGQILFVIGGAGRGKTMLVQEFARRVQEADAELIMVSGHCNAHTGLGDPYLPFREALNMLTGELETRWAAGLITHQQAKRLWELMPVSLPALVEHAPDLIESFIPGQALLSRAATFATDEMPWFNQLAVFVREADRVRLEQSRLFSQYTALLKAIATRQPLLLILEDLHWVDTSSSALLFHLSREVSDSRLLIVGTYRPDEVVLSWGDGLHPLAGIVSELKRQHGDIWLDLGDLAPMEGRQFVEAYLDTQPNRLGAAFREALFRQTEGHALFTVELLREMQERGDLRQDEDGNWAEGETINWNTLPAKVEGVIEKRMTRLEAALQTVLTIASVEGETFTAEVVARVQQLNERELVQQLSRELDKRQRLVTAQGLEWVGEQRLSLYRFRHYLFQHYLYHNLDQMERTYLHEAVGNVLETLYGEQTEQVVVQLAHHFEQAGLRQKAVNYLLQAGKRAARLSANQEAIAHLTKGLTLLETLPDTAERVQQELELQIVLGNALMATKGYAAAEVERVFNRARELCWHAYAGETPHRFPVLYGLWVLHHVRAEHQMARELGQEWLRLAQHQPDAAPLLMAHRVLGVSLLHLGELASAREHLEQSIALYEPQQHRSLAFLYGQDPGIASRILAAWTLWLLGYLDQTLKRSREALALAQELSHPFSLAFALIHAAVLHQLGREGQKAQERVESAIALCTKQGFPFLLAIGTILQDWALAEQGQEKARIAHMRQGLAAYQAIGAGLWRPYSLSLLAQAYQIAGQVKEGLTVLAEALALVEKSDERWWEAELYRLKGELLLKAEGGRLKDEAEAEAEKCFWQAIEVARRQSAKSLELRAVLSLSRLWQKQGKKKEACQMLGEIYGWFTEGFDTADLKEAKVLLEELS
jgi:predicted ATPase/DNA-binding SARP family transcriptional activator